jgi:hypothetical protein
MANMGGVWNMLTLEQLRRLSDEEVTQQVNARLVPFGAPVQGAFVQPADFLAAQYYVSELDRRENRRANAERDRIETHRHRVNLAIEGLIVVLIGAEIVLSILGGRQQSRQAAKELEAFGNMQTVLANLQKSSQATADNLKQLTAVTETMNGAIQTQVELFYDVEVNVLYQESTNRLMVVNQGRTNVTLWGFRIGAGKADIFERGQIISPGGGAYEASIQDYYEEVLGKIEKGSTATVPFRLFVLNDKRQRFMVRGHFVVVWEGDKMIFHAQPNEVIPGWDTK